MKSVLRAVVLFPALALAPLAVSAQSRVLPELYDVQDVRSDDQLNIRAEPDAKSDALGALAPNAKGLEVIAESADGQWLRINTGESSGWVSARYMKQAGSSWQSGQLPQGLKCYGTEPFWDLAVAEAGITLRKPDDAEQTFAVSRVSDRRFEGDRLRVVEAQDATLVVTPQICSDGMSDKLYGLQAILSLRSGAQPLLTGCCSIAP